MNFGDHAIFACPVCNERIVVSSIKGQEFHNRIENPTEFDCPYCMAEIIFSSRTKLIFRIGVFLSFFVSPVVYWLTSKFNLSFAILSGGLLLLCGALMSQKLVTTKHSESLGIANKKESVFARLLSLLGIGSAKSTVQVVEEPVGSKIGLHVLSDFGETHVFVSETPNRRLIISTIRALDWDSGFHQVILISAPGVSMEVGGSLDSSNGLSSIYQDENRDIARVTASPPKTVEDMEAILVSFLAGDGRWERMYDFR